MKLLEVEDLRAHFHTDDGVVRAVDGISFDLEAGRILGIVGESGSGKSVANLSLLGLVPCPPGRVSGRARFEGADLLEMSQAQLRRIRGHRIAMIFQDPMTSLNPFLSVGVQLAEPMVVHLGLGWRAARRRAVELLEIVHVPGAARRIGQYPHQFSGGMRQRVMIAMALSCDPRILIADEPTTALDVTIQAQILELIKEMKEKLGMAVILVTHDLGVVAGMADEVLVMYAGKVAEHGPVGDIFGRPLHPYTRGLLESVPRLDEARRSQLHLIDGNPPDMTRVPSGCPFHPRCADRFEPCDGEYPQLYSPRPSGRVACWLHRP